MTHVQRERSRGRGGGGRADARRRPPRFRDFVAAGRHMPVVDEEHFRLLTGFNDIFVGIAAVILLAAVAMIGYYVPPNIDGDGPRPVSGLLVAATAWGLAEFFTRKRRMALPASSCCSPSSAACSKRRARRS